MVAEIRFCNILLSLRLLRLWQFIVLKVAYMENFVCLVRRKFLHRNAADCLAVPCRNYIALWQQFWTILLRFRLFLRKRKITTEQRRPSSTSPPRPPWNCPSSKVTTSRVCRLYHLGKSPLSLVEGSHPVNKVAIVKGLFTNNIVLFMVVLDPHPPLWFKFTFCHSPPPINSVTKPIVFLKKLPEFLAL